MTVPIQITAQAQVSPKIHDLALVFRGPNGNSTWALSGRRLEQLGVHASETAWVGTKFNVVLDNNGTLDALYQQVKRLVQDHPPAK